MKAGVGSAEWANFPGAHISTILTRSNLNFPSKSLMLGWCDGTFLESDLTTYLTMRLDKMFHVWDHFDFTNDLDCGSPKDILC